MRTGVVTPSILIAPSSVVALHQVEQLGIGIGAENIVLDDHRLVCLAALLTVSQTVSRRGMLVSRHVLACRGASWCVLERLGASERVLAHL